MLNYGKTPVKPSGEGLIFQGGGKKSGKFY
jgi:hypothetical protein